MSEKNRADSLNYDDLASTTLLLGSPATVVARQRELAHKPTPASAVTDPGAL